MQSLVVSLSQIKFTYARQLSKQVYQNREVQQES